MKSPFKVNPKKVVSKGIETGDTQYHSAEIYQVVKDGQLALEVVDNPVGIQETIDTYKDKAGLKNILALYMKTGDKSLFEAHSCLNGIDATSIPTQDPEEMLKTLPAELVGNKSVEEFLRTTSQEDVIKYYEKVNKVDEVKTEGEIE